MLGLCHNVYDGELGIQILLGFVYFVYLTNFYFSFLCVINYQFHLQNSAEYHQIYLRLLGE